MDLDGLEKQWEEGDEEEELKTEQQMMFEMLERRRTEAASTASSFDPRCYTQYYLVFLLYFYPPTLALAPRHFPYWTFIVNP